MTISGRPESLPALRNAGYHEAPENAAMMPTTEKTWTPLNARERRVLGVLVEKQKTTPEYYPMTIAAIVTGSNQKSNRDPVTNYDADDVEDILQGLRKKGAAVQLEGSGRAVKWKHALYDWFDLKNKPVEMAVLAELMLRGPQTEGDLRSRASRMEPLPDLATLQAVLQNLVERGLAIYLSPPGVRRGVVVTHGLYPPDELQKVRSGFVQAADDEPETRVARSSGLADEVAALKADVETLKNTVHALAAEVRTLKDALGS